MIVSHRAIARCSRSPRPVSAALLTRMSRPPNRATAKRINPRQTSSLVRSPSKYSASQPAALTRRTVSAPSARSRPCTTTFDPSCAKCSAIPRPMPEVAPVTTATLPARLLMGSPSISVTLHHWCAQFCSTPYRLLSAVFSYVVSGFRLRSAVFSAELWRDLAEVRSAKAGSRTVRGPPKGGHYVH